MYYDGYFSSFPGHVRERQKTSHMLGDETKLYLQPPFAKIVRSWQNSSVSSLVQRSQETKSCPFVFSITHSTRKEMKVLNTCHQNSVGHVIIAHLMWAFTVTRFVLNRTVAPGNRTQTWCTSHAIILHDGNKLLFCYICETVVRNSARLQIFASKAPTTLMTLNLALSR